MNNLQKEGRGDGNYVLASASLSCLTALEKDYQELEEEGGNADDGKHEEVGDQEGAASVLQTDIK